MRLLGWIPKEDAEGPHASGVGPRSVEPALAWPGMEWTGRIERRLSAGPAGLGERAGRATLAWNLERGADPGVESRWEACLRGRGVVVVTGQQAALLGGPLYTLYKLASAVALSRRIETELGVPALTVFWIVGDDSDFGEVSSTWIPTADGRIVRLRDTETPAGGTMIGGLRADRQIRLLESEAEVVLRHPHGSEALRIMEASAARGESWSGLQAALLFRLLPGLPFMALDGAHPALLEAQRDWLVSAAKAWPCRALLAEGEAEARAAGYEPALDPELGRRLLYRIQDGRRDPLESAPGPGLVGPNVVLRPLLQDNLLPNVATVCGHAEIRYRAQLGPLYRHGGVPQPLRVPRLQAVLAPPLTSDLLGGEALGAYRSAAVDPDGFLDALVERTKPRDLLRQVDRLGEELRERLESLRGPLRDFDPSLPQVLDSSAGKADFQMQRLREGVLGKVRHRLFQREPRLSTWREWFRPRDGEQERALSLLTPYLAEGEASGRDLLETADAHWNRQFGGEAAPGQALLLLNLRNGEEKETRHD